MSTLQERMIMTGERIAVLEAQSKTVLQRLDHIDLCVDKLQRTVWQAGGAVSVLIMLLQLLIYVAK